MHNEEAFMEWLPVALLVVFFVGNLFLYMRLRKKRAPLSSDFVPGWLRPWIAIGWMWGPTLWFVPGLFWLIVSEIHVAGVLLLSIFVPLFYFVIFFLWLGLIPLSRSRDQVFFITLLMLIGMFIYLGVLISLGFGVPLPQFALFLIAISVIPLFSMVLMVIAPLFIVPIEPGTPDLVREAVRMVIGHFTSFPKPVWRIEDGQIQTRVEGNPFYGTGPGWLVTEPENLVVLKNGTKITRLVGPGIALTERGESPFKVVDLRNQIRSTEVTAMTKDGIEIRFKVSSLFRLNREEASVELGKPWPYVKDHVWDAVFAESVEPTVQTPLEANRAHNWQDLPLRIAVRKAKKAIGFYTFAQLYVGKDLLEYSRRKREGTDNPGSEDADEQNGQDPALMAVHREVEKSFGLEEADDVDKSLTRLSIGHLVRRAVRKQLEPLGFEIIGGSIGSKIEPVSGQVAEQRVEEWKKRYVNQIEYWRSEIEKIRIESEGKVRTSRIAELFDTITRELTEVQPSSDAIAYWIIDTFMQITADPKVRKMLPDASMKTLEDLSTWGESQDQEEGR
jgi:hypothetical protein